MHIILFACWLVTNGNYYAPRSFPGAAVELRADGWRVAGEYDLSQKADTGDGYSIRGSAAYRFGGKVFGQPSVAVAWQHTSLYSKSEFFPRLAAGYNHGPWEIYGIAGTSSREQQWFAGAGTEQHSKHIIGREEFTISDGGGKALSVQIGWRIN